jgi:hypothetical protein
LQDQAKDFDSIVQPIVGSPAFARLDKTTFLGILSPIFREIDGYPIHNTRKNFFRDDRSRACHSVSVARIIFKQCLQLKLSRETQIYGILWGLLHDIATWPLSHTGEAAFSKITDKSSRDLRVSILYGDYRLPTVMSLYNVLRDYKIDFDQLVGLFDKSNQSNLGEMSILHQIIHSEMNPDTLEGIQRTAITFGLLNNYEEYSYDIFENDLISGLRIKKSKSKGVLSFLNMKSFIYRTYINDCRIIESESRWSNAIQSAFPKISLIDSLFISESDVLRSAICYYPETLKSINRYKIPLNYNISEKYKSRRSFSNAEPIDILKKIFVRTPIF